MPQYGVAADLLARWKLSSRIRLTLADELYLTETSQTSRARRRTRRAEAQARNCGRHPPGRSSCLLVVTVTRTCAVVSLSRVLMRRTAQQ